jgi:hypothetical protein
LRFDSRLPIEFCSDCAHDVAGVAGQFVAHAPARAEGPANASLPPPVGPFNPGASACHLLQVCRHHGRRSPPNPIFSAKMPRNTFRVPSYWHQMYRAVYRRPRCLQANLQCVRGRASRLECLHLHHPMPTSGRHPHRPLPFLGRIPLEF